MQLFDRLTGHYRHKPGLRKLQPWNPEQLAEHLVRTEHVTGVGLLLEEFDYNTADRKYAVRSVSVMGERYFPTAWLIRGNLPPSHRQPAEYRQAIQEIRRQALEPLLKSFDECGIAIINPSQSDPEDHAWTTLDDGVIVPSHMKTGRRTYLAHLLRIGGWKQFDTDQRVGKTS